MASIPMTPSELAAWTAQQSARYELTFAPARAARAVEAPPVRGRRREPR